MNYIGFILLFLFFIYCLYYDIKQILIGCKVVKSKKYTEEKDLRRLLTKGIIFLVLEIGILIYFLLIIFDKI